MTLEELYKEWIEVKRSRSKQMRKDFFIKTKYLHKKKCACNIALIIDTWFPNYFKREGLL